MRAALLLSLAISASAGNSDKDIKGNSYATSPWDATFQVNLDGKAGGELSPFKIRVHPEWAPEGAKRFQDLVEGGVLNDAKFFRVVPGFMVQFGIPSNPEVAAQWRTKDIQDDKVEKSNTRGMVTYAMAGPNTRTSQIFINYADNSNLDSQGFAPFAEVLDDGMDVVDKIQSKYGEQPDQGMIQSKGNAYLTEQFPDLSGVSTISASFAAPAAKFLELKESL